MLSRLVGRPVSVIRHARLSTKWTNHNLGRRVVMPLPTQHTLLNTHSTATAASHTSEAQSTATAQLPTSFLPASSSDTTPDASNQREILMLQNDEIFIDPRISGIDDQLALMYACLKIGHIERGLHILRTLTDNYRNQKEKFANVNIYNAFIEAYMKQGGQSTRQALYWFDEMRRQKIKPNLTTYAILIKGFARHGPINTARLLLQEMLKEGHELVDLMLNGNLSDVDLKEIKLLSRVNRENKMMISSLHINKLLNSVGKSATKQTETTTTTTKTSVDLSSVPEARSTDVLGVRLLKASLIPLANKEMDLYERQLHLENQAVNASLERLRAVAETRGIEMAFNSYPLRTLMWSWHQKLHPMIAEEQQRVHNHAGRVDTFIYGPFLTLLDAEKLSILTIQQLLRLSTDKDVINGIRTARAVTEVGRAIEMEYYAEQLRERSNTLTKRRCLNLQALYSSGKLFDMHVRKIQARLLEKEEEGNWLARWPEFIRVKLGSLLTSMLMKVAKIKTTHYDKETGKKITEEVDAFYHTYSFKGGHRMGVIRFNDKLVDLFSRDNLRDVLDPRMLPMLVMPRPWVNFESGGYMSRKTLCMRIKNSPEQYHYLKEASMKGHITKVLQGLDVLGSQPWTVNRKVFNAALEAWNSGKAYPSIPPLHESLVLPPKPPDYDTNLQARMKWYNASKEAENEYRNHHSQRCDTNYKIEIARAFLGETIYFPHNLDFRGRAYPIPPLFNHLGNDICRGLLLFAEGKELGENGLRWLKIHLASLAGYDKHSFAERIKFVEDNMENIYDSADNPLGGKRWWLKAEDPWQCLAACIELTEAMRSPDPFKYESRLPVHQDGTCNGLQHYAALGGDAEGATQVNLLPSDFPQDVYTGVCNLVNRAIEIEAEQGVEEAVALRGHITRKIVKQTVMTNVYGVTFVGAREQIANRLRELPDIEPDKVWGYSTYLTHKVFGSLGQMFTGARALQDWLNEAARRIAKSLPAEALNRPRKSSKKSKKASKEGNNTESATEAEDGKTEETKNTRRKQKKVQPMTCVIWTTPLGLPIVQPYRRVNRKLVRTTLQGVYITDPTIEMPVNSQKQRTAFPPNFVHSLDATHMIMSAIACKERGLSFAAVHDSYWTHACDIDTMNKVLREQFIELHKQPLMENLRNEFIERYKGHMMPASILKEDEEVNSAETETIDSESNTLVNPLDPADETEELLEDDVSDPEPDSLLEEGTVIQVDEPEPKPAKRKRRTKKELWVPIEFPPLPPRGEFDITEVEKSDYFFH